MKRLLCFVIAMSIFICAGGVAMEQKSKALAKDPIDALMESFWGSYLKLHPAFAYSLGENDGTRRFDDLSDYGRAQLNTLFNRTLKEADLLSRLPNLTHEQQVNLDTLIWVAENEKSKTNSPLRFLIFNDVYSWLDAYMIVSRGGQGDLNAYGNELTQLADHVDQNTQVLHEAVAANFTQPCKNTKAHANIIAGYLRDDMLETQLMAPFVAQDSHPELASSARKAVKKAVTALTRYHEYLAGPYLNACRAEIGLWSLPGGELAYADGLKYFTSTNMTADQIHLVGLQEVSHLMEQVERIRTKLVKNGQTKAETSAELFSEMRTDPKLGFASRTSVLEMSDSLLSTVKSNMDTVFWVPGHMADVSVEPMDASIEAKSAGGFYSYAATKGTVFVNTYKPESLRTYSIPSLILHEAIPGHHYQLNFRNQLSDLPKLRTQYYFHSLGEGWALYAETLSNELVGSQLSEYDHLGQLSMSLLRASRLVVDTGIHAKQWSRAQAYDYMSKNTALSKQEIENEIERYITFPAQAVSYKIGELKIRQLKEMAQRRFADQFELRDFHSKILESTSLPLELMEDNIIKWVDSSTLDLSVSGEQLTGAAVYHF